MVINLLIPRVKADVATLYVQARVAGLTISHHPDLAVHEFDGAPVAGCELGVFRAVGALLFLKDDRRWHVTARCDASELDLSTLISTGLMMVREYGRTPGQITRKRMFRQEIGEKTGKPLAITTVCYQLDATDLLGSAQAEAALTDDALHRVLDGMPA